MKTKLVRNKTLIRKIIAAVRKQPLRMNMNTYFNERDGIAPCGTTGCIAGFAIALSHKTPKKLPWRRVVRQVRQTFLGSNLDYDREAAKLLRIKYHVSRRLFFVATWPLKFRAPWEAAQESDDRVGQSKAVIDRLKYLLDTGK